MMLLRQFKHVTEHLRPALQELAAAAPDGPVALRLRLALATLPAGRWRRLKRHKTRARPTPP